MYRPGTRRLLLVDILRQAAPHMSRPGTVLLLLVDILRQAALGSDRHGPQNRVLRLLPVVVLLLNPLLLLHLLRFTTTTFLRNLDSLDVISQGR